MSSLKSENQDSEKTKVSFLNRIIYMLRDLLEFLKGKTRSIILTFESHKSFEFYGLYVLICMLSTITTIKFDWIYFTLISLKVLINASYVGFAPLVLIVSIYLFFDILIYLSIPFSMISEILDISIPCVLYFSMRKLGFIKDFKFEYTFVVTASFLILQIVVWIGFLIHPLSMIIHFVTLPMFSKNGIISISSIYKSKGILAFMVNNERSNFGDGMMGLIKLWKFEFNKVLAAHCTTFLILLVILYIYNSIKSNFEFICSLLGIIIPTSPIIAIKDLTENSVEIYWYEPKEHKKSINDVKNLLHRIGHYISYPYKRLKNKKSSSSSLSDVDNTLSDLISISKQHGENTYHFSLNSKDTTNHNTKLKFPKSTSTTNFKTTHYDKDTNFDTLEDSDKSDNNLHKSDENLKTSEDKDNLSHKPSSEKTNSRIGYVVKKDKNGTDEQDGKILLDGKEMDIKNFATEIKKEIGRLDRSFNYEESLKNATGFKLFLYKYGFQKRNEITYQVEVNGYILNDENLHEKHIIIDGLKPSTSYKIRIWAIMNNRIKSPSSFVNIKTLKSYSGSLNKAKVSKASINEKSVGSYEDHLKTIEKIDNDIIEINQEFERLKKQRLEFTKQVNDINDQYKEEEIPLRKQLEELKLEKNEVDEVRLQHKGVLKELKEDKRRVDLLKSQREQGLKTKERGKQQLIDRCNRCQTDINKLQKDMQRLEEKEQSFNVEYEKAKKDYNEEKDKYMKEQSQLKEKLKEEKKHHKALVKELNDKKSKYKQIETSHRKIIQDNRERNKEKLKVDEEYKLMLKKYKEMKEKNTALKNQLKMENKEKIKLLQDLNEIHQQSDSEDSSDLDDQEDMEFERVDSISDDLASNSTLSKSNSDPSTNTPSYSNTNSNISRNSSEENTVSRPIEFNLFNNIDDSYESIPNDSQYSTSSRNSSPITSLSNSNSFINRNESRYTNNNTSNGNNKSNAIKSRFYSYPLENQNSFNANIGGFTNKSNNDQPSSKYERNGSSYNENNENRFGVGSPRQKPKQTPKMKNLIPFFSYNSYVPTTETSTDSKLLSTSLEDDLMPETSSKSNTKTNKPPKSIFSTSTDNSVSPLMASLSQANMNSTLSKVTPKVTSNFSPQISNLSPLLLNENHPLGSNTNSDFNTLGSTSSNFNTNIFSNLLKNNYNTMGLGNQGAVSSSLNTTSLYSTINNPINGDANTTTLSSTANAPNTGTKTNNLNFLFGGNLGNNQTSLDGTFHSPRTNNAQLNGGSDLNHSGGGHSGTGESSLPRSSFSPLISPQTKNSSLMSGFSSIPSYYQNLKTMSNDVNDLLGSTKSSSLPMDSTLSDGLEDSGERSSLPGKSNSFGNNTSPSNYLFNNYFSMPNYSQKNSGSESNPKDSYLHDYLNSRLAGYQSFYNKNMFNSSISGGFFNEPSSTGSFNPMSSLSKNDLDFSNGANATNNNNIDDEDIDLNFTYNLELSDSESEDVDTSDIDISKIIDLSQQKEIKK